MPLFRHQDSTKAKWGQLGLSYDCHDFTCDPCQTFFPLDTKAKHSVTGTLLKVICSIMPQSMPIQYLFLRKQHDQLCFRMLASNHVGCSAVYIELVYKCSVCFHVQFIVLILIYKVFRYFKQQYSI